MNILRKIFSWRGLNLLVCSAEWIVAFLCVVMMLCTVSLPGGHFGLELMTLMLGFFLFIFWAIHALLLFIYRSYGRAKKLRAYPALYLLMVALCVVVALCDVPLEKARLALSRDALEAAAADIGQHQDEGWIGLYFIGSVRRNGGVVEYQLVGAGLLDTYYLIYAPAGLAEYRNNTCYDREDPKPLGENWWYVRESF